MWWWFIKKATWKARGNTIHTPWQVKRNNSCHPHAVTQHLRQVVSLTLTGSKVFLGFWNVTVLLCFWIKELWQIYIYKNWSSTKYTFYKWMHLYKTTYADMIIIWKYCVKSQMLTNQINIILDFLDL